MSTARLVQPLTEVEAAALDGLSRTPKSLPPWLFYDDRGSQLFEAITRTPEYYLTRVERSIFERHAPDIMDAAEWPRTILELGAGSAEKTPVLLQAALANGRELTYIPIDVCAEALDLAKQSLQSLPGLTCRPLITNYANGIPRQNGGPGRRMVLYIGSSIGNFHPKEGASILARITRSLSPGDSVLLGVDMAKDRETLLAAYNDAEGVTAEFNRNMLARLNREMGADFDLNSFRHVAIWNATESRMEMYLESTRRQRVRLAGLKTISFEQGERLHTENSYKFSDAKVRQLLDMAGLQAHTQWQDSRCWFAVYLAKVPDLVGY